MLQPDFALNRHSKLFQNFLTFSSTDIESPIHVLLHWYLYQKPGIRMPREWKYGYHHKQSYYQEVSILILDRLRELSLDTYHEYQKALFQILYNYFPMLLFVTMRFDLQWARTC